MLNKLPPKVMETILGRLNSKDYQGLAGVSPRMWKIVEETPKHYTFVSFMMGFSASTGYENKPETPIEIPRSLPFKLRPPKVMGNFDGDDKVTNISYSSYFRLYLANSTVQKLIDPQFSFGSQFWVSLNMKVKHFFCFSLTTFEEVQPIFASLRPSELECSVLFMTDINPGHTIKFLADPVICSMEQLHIYRLQGQVKWLDHCHAKDLKIGRDEADHQPVFDFLTRKILKWLDGMAEIEKIQFYDDRRGPAAAIEFETYIRTIPFLVPSHLGWVDRTYEGMYLILRASDGKALLAYYDNAGRSCYLIGCEYNFRRGRCLGSYEQNGKALRNIRNLMSLSSRLSTQNPKLAADAKEKLKEECIKFNEYNKGATEMDLLVDSIWRPKRQRRSVWGSFNGNVLPTDKYPVDPSIRHAYKFTKAFETTGVLPEIDEFKPADGKEIEDWKQRFPEFAF